MSKQNVAVVGRKGTVLLPLDELKRTFFVRKELNQDRVLFFMELYESGAEVPPLEVIRGSMEIFDGRHRDAALQHMERKHAECLLIEPMEQAEQFVEAFGRNMGGALPPTRLDAVFVMKQLLEVGIVHGRIKSLFAPRYFRPSHADKLLKDAKQQINEVKLKRAVNAVAHGDVNVAAAAAEYGVDADTLRNEISGKKRKGRKLGITELKTEISNRYRGNSNRTVAIFRDLLDKYEDGEIPEKKVLEVFGHVERLLKDGARRITGWRQRFEALKGSSKAKS